MDRVSIYLVRAALLWLVFGFALGALMLSDALAPGSWRLWFAPTHGHILFVGWFLQFAVGVGYWLLPRKRSPERPEGYHATAALVAFALLNSGLLLRVIVEPLGRSGRGSDALDVTLAVSSLLQLAAIVIIARQIWGRVLPRRKRAAPDGNTG
jgi:hypothetical protein